MVFRKLCTKHNNGSILSLNFILILLLSIFPNQLTTFHIPGISSHKFKRYEPIKIYAKNIEYENGLQAFDFFDYFCGEDSTVNNEEISDTFLDKFFNDVAHITPFRAIMSINQECKTACSYNLKMNPNTQDGTYIRFYVESLTSIGVVKHPKDSSVNYYRLGVPLVSYHNYSSVLNNHFKFVIYVNGLEQENDPNSKDNEKVDEKKRK